MSLRNLANKIALIRTRFNSLNNWARVGSAIVLVLKYGSLLAVGTGVGVWVYYSLSDWKVAPASTISIISLRSSYSYFPMLVSGK